MLLQFLPAGFGLPPLPYLIALLGSIAVVGYGLIDRDPAVTDGHVLSFVPWMLLGAVLHVLHVVGAAPPTIDPLLGTPSVYLSTAVVAGTVWLVADRTSNPTKLLVGIGTAALIPVVGIACAVGLARGTFSPLLPVAALVTGTVLGLTITAGLFRAYLPSRITGGAGALVLVGHTVDGVTTAVGVDLLGFGERSPASRVILEFAAGLPTAPALGTGWLFVLVKLVVAVGVVAAMAGYVREAPREGRLLLGGVAAVGLGPGFHNAVLFAIAA